MTLRASFLAVAGSAVVVLVSAYTHSGLYSIHADTLARYEAITSYCGKADPDSTSQYLSKLASLTSGHSKDELAGHRNSARYRNAFADANVTLSNASVSTGLRGCTEFLAEK